MPSASLHGGEIRILMFSVSVSTQVRHFGDDRSFVITRPLHGQRFLMTLMSCEWLSDCPGEVYFWSGIFWKVAQGYRRGPRGMYEGFATAVHSRNRGFQIGFGAS